MFQEIQAAPKDAILGITESYKADPNPDKINLSVGIYQDSEGNTPVLGSVAEASRRVLANQSSMSYLPIPGSPEYASEVQKLLFGAEHEVATSGRAATAHTPGGTGALRVVGDFLHANLQDCTLHLTNPTWPNHSSIFAAAGVTTETVPYFNVDGNALAFDELTSAIAKLAPGNAILLHGCCHNPTGIDPTPQQWQQLAELVRERGLLPVLDFAYQGFADGIEADATSLHAFAQPGQELIICSSFSKNFGLYRQRVGAATFVAGDAETTAKVRSQMNKCIRSNYSNPPAYGASLVTTVLSDNSLRDQWEGEVASMRDRINNMRNLFVQKLAEHGVPGDFSFITKQRGMFSFSGLSREQVDRLRDEHSIYIVDSGRINVAGITETNVDTLAAAIAATI